MNRGVVENLIKSGAFDSLDSNRAKLLNALPQLTELAARKAQNTNQASLFGDDEEDFFTPEMEEVPDFSERQKLDLEKESMGLYISGHPFDQYEPSVEPYITCPVGDLPNWRSHQPAVTAGCMTNFTEKFSKAGNRSAPRSSRTTEARSTCSYSASAGRSTSTRSRRARSIS